MTKTGGVRTRAVTGAARLPAGRASRAALLLFKAVAAAAVVAVIGMGLLYVRLMHSPVTLGFLVRPIETGIAEELAGLGVRVESVALGLDGDGLFQFELKNLRVSNAAGESLVSAPSAAISLSRRAMLRGRIAAESLDLVSARLVLFYSEDGSLSLKFSADAGATAPGRPPALRGAIETAAVEAVAHRTDNDSGTFERIDLVKALSEASARARRREHAGAYLREVGLRSATVIIDNGQRKSIWRVPELDLDLDHRRSRSSIAGRAKIESLTGPWEINFRSSERASAKSIHLAVSIQGLNPRGLARILPELAGLENLDLPIWGDAQLELSQAGELLKGKIVVDSAPGTIAFPLFAATPLSVDGTHFELTYDGAARRFDISQAILRWGDSRLQLAGSAVHAVERDQGTRWDFDLKGTEGFIAAEPPVRPQLPLDGLTIRGFFAPARGEVSLSALVLRVGGTEVRAAGDVSDITGAVRARLDAQIGAMPVSLFKTLWPGWIAPGTRSWLSTRLTGGNVDGGVLKVVQGYGSASGGQAATGDADRVSLTLEGSNLELDLADGWPTLQVGRGLLRLDRNAVEFAVPEATMVASDGRKFTLKGAFAVDLREPLPRIGQIVVKGEGPLSLALDLLDKESAVPLRNAGIVAANIDGKLDANLTIGLQLVPTLKLREAHVGGRVRVLDGMMRNAFGSLEAQGVNGVIDFTPKGAEAKADLLIGGVPAKASWHRAFDATPDRKSSLRISASLDESERAQLGLDLNDLVRGEVGVELIVHHDAKGERQAHFRADLTNAELKLEGLAWQKPPGQSCTFEFDLVKGTAYPNELRNVRLVGNDVAVAGWMGADADFKVKEFRLPQFTLDVISVFETHGRLRADNVWEVFAKGPTFDGKDLFRSFFDVDVAPDRGPKKRTGLDLRAEIDTVLGHYDTRLHGVKITMQKRAGKMSQLDARGSLAGNKFFEASVRNDPGRPRMLRARANDAGQMFKLVGFYPHAVGGEMNLEVNLDGKGAVERTGVLTATKFHVLGDTVTLQNSQKMDAAARRQIAREKFPFETLRAPFAVGNGQFVLRDAVIDGPLVSANMRGKLDFRTRKLHVGGTFTPLSDLNRVLRGIPLFGGIVTGPRGDGVIAVTYALKGGLENPQLEINPLSVLTPGFTRGIMEITPEDPNVEAPPTKSARGRGGKGRSNPPDGARPGDTGNAVSDGWRSNSQ